MTDESAMISAILAAPDDDSPRLIFADWLDEHGGDVVCPRCDGGGKVGVSFLYRKGDPLKVEAKVPHGCTDCSGTGYVSNGNAERAEYIRVSIKEFNLHQRCNGSYTAADNAEANTLRNRKRKLWSRLKWRQEISVGKLGLSAVKWSRGFVDAVTLTAADWLQHGDQILASQPVTTVSLTTRPRRDTFTGSDWLEFVSRQTDEEFFRHRWPSVRTWNLPTTFADVRDSQFRAVVRKMGVPGRLLEWDRWVIH